MKFLQLDGWVWLGVGLLGVLRLGAAEERPVGTNLLERMDADGDGVVTRAEFVGEGTVGEEAVRAEGMFARLDADGDGQLDPADRELRARRDEEGWLGALRREFAALDGDGDGKLGLVEFRAGMGQWRVPDGLGLSADERLESFEAGRDQFLVRKRRSFEKAQQQFDQNDDGQITRLEVEQQFELSPDVEAAFQKHDKNSDGVLDGEEMSERMTSVMQDYDATLSKVIEERSSAADSDLAGEVKVDDPVQFLFAATDLDRDAALDFEEYQAGRFRLRGQGEAMTREEEAEFWSQEGARSGRGLLLGKHEAALVRLFQQTFDIDGDGKVSPRNDGSGTYGELDNYSLGAEFGDPEFGDRDQDGFISQEEFLEWLSPMGASLRAF